MWLTRCLCSRANTHDERSERMICRIQEWNDEATIFSPSKLSIWEAIDRKDCCFFKGTIFDRSFVTMIRPGSFAVTKKMKRELLIYNETNHFDHNDCERMQRVSICFKRNSPDNKWQKDYGNQSWSKEIFAGRIRLSISLARKCYNNSQNN